MEDGPCSSELMIMAKVHTMACKQFAMESMINQTNQCAIFLLSESDMEPNGQNMSGLVQPHVMSKILHM